MTENEAKAIKWMKNIQDDAVVKLDHIKNNEPNVSPILYEGRKEKAETIIKGFGELEQYRAIGTIEDITKVVRFLSVDNDESIIDDIEEVTKYRLIGAVEECWEAREKQKGKKPNIWGDGYDDKGNMVYDMYDCPGCGKSYEIGYDDYRYCPECGQSIDWGDSK